MKQHCKRGHLRSQYDKLDNKGYRYCSKCQADHHIRWKKENPEAYAVFKTRSRFYMATHRYGLSTEDYRALIAQSGGRCRICDVTFSMVNYKRRCHIDHDHKTGIVRGLLCHSCNNGLGNFNDNTEFMANAINYLKDHEIKNFAVTKTETQSLAQI